MTLPLVPLPTPTNVLIAWHVETSKKVVYISDVTTPEQLVETLRRFANHIEQRLDMYFADPAALSAELEALLANQQPAPDAHLEAQYDNNMSADERADFDHGFNDYPEG